MRLTDPQIELYSRQILLRELGGTGQLRLLESRCLAVGAGIGLETALSYLAGAGIGAIDFLSTSADEESRDRVFAPLRERAPDLRLGLLSLDRTLALDEYDVVIAEGAPASPVVRGTVGAPRRGALRIDEEDGVAVRLTLVPAGGDGCFACVGATPRSFAAGDTPNTIAATSIALGMAGAMAALAACRWIAGIGSDDASRVLRLAHDSVTFAEIAMERCAPCPRGCPS